MKKAKLEEWQKAIIKKANDSYAMSKGASKEELGDKEALYKKEIRQVDMSADTWSTVESLAMEWGVSEREVLDTMLSEPRYKEIPVLRQEDSSGGVLFVPNNANGFHPGDIIQITEKFDGSNASVRYMESIGRIVPFSMRSPLGESQNLSGFTAFADEMANSQKEGLKRNPNYRVFGEWSTKNKIFYADTGKVPHFYVFDILDEESGEYLPQIDVEIFCEKYGFERIKELYYGPFISWEHVRGFLHANSYGDKQEGVVVKNQTVVRSLHMGATEEQKRFLKSSPRPYYVKIVNDEFKERMKVKTPDPAKEAEKERVRVLAESVVTPARVEKMLCKLVNEGVLPNQITPESMGEVAKVLPKFIFDDCKKEAPEVAEAAGETFGKVCASLTMKLAKSIIFEQEAEESIDR